MSITLADLEAVEAGEPARHMPAPRDPTEPAASDVLQWFLDYYWIRHELSRDTLVAWRGDLLSLEIWLSVFRYKTLADAAAADIRDFLDVRYKAANGSLREQPSVACIKRFFFFLVEVGVRKDDPTERVYPRAPQVTRSNLALVPGGNS